MKKSIIMLFAAGLMLTACEKQKETSAMSFVLAAFEDALTEGRDLKEMDQKYLSENFKKLCKRMDEQVEKVKAATDSDETWYYEDNHWRAGILTNSFTVTRIEEIDRTDDKYQFVVELKGDDDDIGESYLTVKKENGQWVIDDFNGETEIYENYINSPYYGMKLKDVCELEGVQWFTKFWVFQKTDHLNLAFTYDGVEYYTNAEYGWCWNGMGMGDDEFDAECEKAKENGYFSFTPKGKEIFKKWVESQTEEGIEYRECSADMFADDAVVVEEKSWPF